MGIKNTFLLILFVSLTIESAKASSDIVNPLLTSSPEHFSSNKTMLLKRRSSMLYTVADNKQAITSHFEFELKYDNDNYLYGLKKAFHAKDGNDYGCTFMIGSNVSYLWKTNKLTLSYTKALFTAPVLNNLDQQLRICDKTTGTKYNVARQIDLDRIALKFRSGDALFVESMIGVDNRSRTSSKGFSAAGLQDAFHTKILNIKTEYYYAPAGDTKTGDVYGNKHIAAEHLADILSPISIRFGNTVGANYSMKNLNVRLKFSMGYIVSTETNRFIGPNSNVFCAATVAKKFGKKDWFELLYTNTLSLYQTSYATAKQIGYVQGVGIGVNKFKVKPYCILNIPKGRQEYTQFNDTDPLFRIGFMW